MMSNLLSASIAEKFSIPTNFATWPLRKPRTRKKRPPDVPPLYIPSDILSLPPLIHPLIPQHPGDFRMRSSLAGFLIASACVAAAQTASSPVPPATPKHPVVDTYYDVRVTDNYRWLEDGSSPEVRQWVAEQNGFTAAL